MNQKCMMPNMKLVENNNLKDFTVELLNKYLLTYIIALHRFVHIYNILFYNI